MKFKVFPCFHKEPLITGWKELASSDPAMIQHWQTIFAGKMTGWGVATGLINDILVLDVDVKPGENGFQSMQNVGLQIPDAPHQVTGGGGSHYFFKYPNDGGTYGNAVKFQPGLDVRGEGGYVVWYGSGFDFNKAFPEAPSWVMQACKRYKNDQTLVESNMRLAPEIAQGILEGALQKIREAPAGESNNILNVQAYVVGQLVASQGLTREAAEMALMQAAIERKKPEREAKATIGSGLDAGQANPFVSPFAEPPKPAFIIPPPPELPSRWTPRHLTREDLLNTMKLRKPQLFRDWSTEDIHVTTADGGTGKTTLKLYEAICLALGDRFLGFENRQQGRTLFITGEDTEAKLAAMMGQIMQQMGLFKLEPENEQKIRTVLTSVIIKKDADLCLITKDRQGFIQSSEEAFRKIMQAVEDFKPKMIVFDPIASFWGSESMLNDMNKAVTKFMSRLVDESGACVEMINHMGKSSSAAKDMTQFAGRGGSGLPSNSRVSRVMRKIDATEFTEATDKILSPGQSAILCNVNKFSDGSPLVDKPFVILREGFLFTRIPLTQKKMKEVENNESDMQRVMGFVKECRTDGKFPTLGVLSAHFINASEPIAIARVKRAVDMLSFSGIAGERLRSIDNPDLSIKERAFIIVDADEKEI